MLSTTAATCSSTRGGLHRTDDPRYREPVDALRCFRGINTLSAMILVAEIVDFQRTMIIGASPCPDRPRIGESVTNHCPWRAAERASGGSSRR